MANFEKKTIKQIYDGIITKYTTLRNEYEDEAPLLEKAVVRSLAYAFAGVAGTLWQLATWIYKQCFPQTCGLTTLKFWGNLVGVEYKTGQATNLTIKLTGVTAQSLSAGATYKHLTSGLIYKTLSAVNESGGEIVATAQCTTPGEVGNINVGETLQIANPYDGIPSTATVTAVAIAGTEDEKTEDYRKRVLYRYRTKSQGGSALDYFNWSLEVTGIVDALIYVLTEGVVSIYLVGEGTGNNRTPSGSVSPDPFPVWADGEFQDFTGSGQFLAVANSIEGSSPGVHDRRPATAKVNLLRPLYEAYSVEISGLTDTSYNEKIKETLISSLDSKRPHIKVLGYKLSNAKINRATLIGDITAIIGEETFTSFVLKNENGTSIEESTLGIGSLAYLSQLTINGVNIAL